MSVWEVKIHEIRQKRFEKSRCFLSAIDNVAPICYNGVEMAVKHGERVGFKIYFSIVMLYDGANRLVKYRPNQRRDAHGRWVNEGGRIESDRREKYLGRKIIDTDNQSIREWYVVNVSDIPNQIDRDKPFKEQVRQSFDLRNKYKREARAAMADRETTKKLEAERPIKPFDELLADKIKRKGLTEDEALEDILKTASATNEDVNNQFGL